MEKIITALVKPFPLFSLQDLCAINLSIILSNNEQLHDIIMDFELDFRTRLFAKNGNEWKVVLSLANELLLKICKSAKINNMIMEQLWSLSYRMMLWRSKYVPSVGKEFLSRFYWTARVRIDSARTGRPIIGNQNIPIRERFRVACNLCFGKEIHQLFQEMSHEDKDFFQSECNEKLRPLYLIWIDTVRGLEIEHENFTEAFAFSTQLGLLEAVKYLFSVAPENIQSDMAIGCEDELIAKVNDNAFLEEDEIELGYLMFSKLSQYNQGIVFNRRTALTLTVVLHSSEQEYFIKELSNRLPYLSTSVIETFLRIIFHNYFLKINDDYDYQELFVDVWKLLPESVKDSLKANADFRMHFLRVLIKGEFQCLLELSENTEECKVLPLEYYVLLKPKCFETDRWRFLLFLMEERIVRNAWLTSCRSVFLNFIEEKKLPKLLQSLKIGEMEERE